MPEPVTRATGELRMQEPGSEDDDLAMILLEAALSLPAEQRKRYLRDACKDNPDLLETLEQQVALEERLGDFLLHPLLRRSETIPPFLPGDLVSGRFRVVRKLGEGGMGVIYEAIDEKLQQRRALKCAKAGFQRRLSPEACAATRITHDNICRIFEIHTAETNQGPVDFLCMEYLEGETLSEYLAGQGPLSRSEASSIVRQLCAGLSSAHKEGLLHRDLKPNNIMLTPTSGGHRVVITDFGLAREASLPAETDVRRSSGLAGTPAYIAPELWLGAKASTASDVYALGVIIYEMVSGRLPFPPETPIEVRTKELPQRPASWVRKLDRTWDRTILKCLEPAPEKRFQLEEIAQAFEPKVQLPRRSLVWRGLAAATVMAVLLQVFAYFRAGSAVGSRPITPIRLAILPVVAADVVFAEGLSYDLSDRFQRIPDRRLVTIPVADVFQRRVSEPSAASSRLGATHVLQYQVRRAGGKVILHATVTDAQTLVKVREFEGEYEAGNLSGMATALFGVVMASFDLTSGLPNEQINAAAYPYYSQAIFFNRRDNRSSDLAIPLFEKAIALDPKCAMPYAGLMEAYLKKYRRSGDSQWLDRARQALRGAESRNPDSVTVHIEAGNLDRNVGSYETAVAHYRRAIQLQPSSADAWSFLARTYELMPGRQTDAAHAFQEAVDLQPGYYGPENNFSNFYIHAGNYVEAEPRLKRVVSMAPKLALGYSNLCYLYDVMGRLEDAEHSCRRALQMEESTAALNNLAVIYEHRGRDSDALDYYRRAVGLAPKRYLYYQGEGDCYRRMKKRREAREAYRQGRELAADALAENPSDAEAHAFSGYFSARLQDFKNAEREVSQALRLASHDMEIVRVAALAEEAMHNRNKSLDLVRGSSRAFLESLGREPEMAEFQHDSRFQSLMAP